MREVICDICEARALKTELITNKNRKRDNGLAKYRNRFAHRLKITTWESLK